jgi:hypothetical protein
MQMQNKKNEDDEQDNYSESKKLINKNRSALELVAWVLLAI